MKYDNIEDVVRTNVPFTHGSSATGWQKTYCAACGDGARTKGPRGNWLFASNDMLFYNCYNCGIKANFDPNREFPFSKNMWSILKAYDIPLRDVYGLIKHEKGKEPRVVKPQPLKFETLELPEHFYPLTDGEEDNPVVQRAFSHLIDERRVDPYSVPFYLSTGHTNSSDPKVQSIARSYTNRLIIPAYVDDKLIGYEGMALGTQGTKYLREGHNLIHGYNNIFNQDANIPLFVFEGYWDAHHFNGVATLTNNLTTKQIELLDRSPRPKVVVPDRLNTHHALAEMALGLEWGVALPHIRPYKDVSEAIKHYGTLFVQKSAMESIKYGNIAKISMKLYNFV